MGYFPNGTAGEMYEEEYCDRCIHQLGPEGKSGCSVFLAHLLYNYEECNNNASILDCLIPRNADGQNGKCTLFYGKERP